MKKQNWLILLVIITNPFFTFGQNNLEHLNFDTQIGSRKLSWELIVQEHKPNDELIKSYLENVIIKNNIPNHELSNNSINGSAKEVHMPGSRIPMNFNYKISFKESRYRIQISEIIILTSTTSLDGFSFGDTPIEAWFLNGKGTKFRTSGMNGQLMESMDIFFKDKFILNYNLDDEDDW